MAAFSDSAAIGMWATRSQAATTSAGRPSRSAPTSSVTSPAVRAGLGAAAARATSAMRSPGSSPARRTRATGTAKIAPIDARTALGPNGSAQPGPSATLPPRRRAPRAAPSRRCPGRPRPTAPRTGARTAAPSAARRRRSRACPSRARDAAASTCGSTSVPCSRLPSATSRSSAASPRRRPPRAGPRPRPRSAALAPAPAGGGFLELVVVGAGDHGSRTKGRRPGRRPRGGACRLGARSGRRRLAGALGESAERLGVADGDVGQHLAVELDRRPASGRA